MWKLHNATEGTILSDHASTEDLALADVFAQGGECGAVLAARDWNDSPLGPVDSWPQSLRTALGIVLRSRHPLMVWWGPELVALYNNAIAPSFGKNHPAALGRPGGETFTQMWPVIGSMMADVMSTGEATWRSDEPLPMDRHGFVEDTYWTYSYSPVHVESGAVGGVFTATSDTTERVLATRRLLTLQRLGESFLEAVDEPGVAEKACASLARASDDISFALVYRDAPEGMQLIGSFGLTPGDPAAPVVLSPGQPGSPWPAVDPDDTSGRDVPITELPELGALSGSVRCARVLPLVRTGHLSPHGMIVIGCGERVDVDERYVRFLEQVATGISRACTDAKSHEAERERAEMNLELATARATLLEHERAARVDVELRATRAEMQLERVIEAAGDGVWVLDSSGRTLLVNPAAERMTGWTSSELIGQDAHASVHHSHADGSNYPQTECPIWRSAVDGTPCSIDSEVFWRRDGTSFPVVYTSHPMFDAAGVVVGAVIIFRDVSEQKDAEERQSQFFAMASHELRTPLTAISGFADTLTHRWETLPEEQRRGFVQIIQEQSERLVRLINDVLTVSRLERGGLAVEARPISLLRLITRVVEGVGIDDVQVSCAPELSAFSDPDHLEQVLINYLANARKYGEYPIHVQASSDADWVTIEVRDHGQGVPVDFRARLFDRFTQAAFRPEGGGTGLGLSIVQGLAAAQGGRAWFEPNLPTGSRFFVQVPAAPHPPPAN